MCNPTYNSCQIAGLSKLESGPLYMEDMIWFVGVLSAVMDVREQGKLFCSLLQFQTGHELLLR